KHYNWFDPGSCWSGDTLPLREGYRLGAEIAVLT
ncbi:MAG: guanylate cyclase, partial [Actinomycetota bacterium]|nr:guanylate cyclase [Actinomycetota bacterium]